MTENKRAMANPSTVGICIALNELIEHTEQVVWETVTTIAEIAGLEVVTPEVRTTLKVVIPDEQEGETKN